MTFLHRQGGGGSTQKLLVEDWTANTNYEKGQLIQYNNNVYLVEQNFTSGETFDSTDLMLIGKPDSNYVVRDWEKNTEFKFGELIKYNTRLYFVKETHVSGEEFDTTKADKVSYMQDTIAYSLAL